MLRGVDRDGGAVYVSSKPEAPRATTKPAARTLIKQIGHSESIILLGVASPLEPFQRHALLESRINGDTVIPPVSTLFNGRHEMIA